MSNAVEDMIGRTITHYRIQEKLGEGRLGAESPQHRHLHDIDTFEGVDFIAMEHARGELLSRVLASRVLSMEDVLNYATQIAGALSAAHCAGIVHRDIKWMSLPTSSESCFAASRRAAMRVTLRRPKFVTSSSLSSI